MKRHDWIDIAKGIGILLVILAHTRFATSGISHWINSFHMPLFFLMAGLCYDENRYPTYWSYFKRKCGALLYPYVTLSLLVIALMSVLYLGNEPNFSSYSLLCNMCKGGTIGAFWFIWVLLEVELCYAILARCVFRMGERLLLCALCGIVAVSLAGKHLLYLLDIMMLALPFYGVGHCMRKVMIKPNRMMVMILLLLGFVHLIIVKFAFPYSACFAANSLFVPYLFFVLAFAGSFFISGLSMLIERIGSYQGGVIVKNLLTFLGKNSIILLATHNALGICRASWCTHFPEVGAFWFQLIEIGVLLMLLFLLSGPLNCLIRIQMTRRSSEMPN